MADRYSLEVIIASHYEKYNQQVLVHICKFVVL